MVLYVYSINVSLFHLIEVDFRRNFIRGLCVFGFRCERMVNVDKTVVHQSLKDWLKTFRKEPKYLSHVWIYPDRLETTISKDIAIKDIGDVTVYTRYIVPFINEFETRGDKKITAICLSSGDAVNFLNFLQASNPERIVYDCWPNNSSEWATKRNLSYE